jgi:hypothetical protein
VLTTAHSWMNFFSTIKDAAPMTTSWSGFGFHDQGDLFFVQFFSAKNQIARNFPRSFLGKQFFKTCYKPSWREKISAENSCPKNRPQIARILAHWVIVFFGQFFYSVVTQIYILLFSTETKCFNFDKKRLGFWERIFHKCIWSPCS